MRKTTAERREDWLLCYLQGERVLGCPTIDGYYIVCPDTDDSDRSRGEDDAVCRACWREWLDRTVGS